MLPVLATLVLAAVCNSSAPTPLSPAKGEQVRSMVTFTWTAVEGAKGYRVSIVEGSLDIDVVAETTRTTATARLGPGSYAWYVEAFFDRCPSTVSQALVFEVKRAQSCTTVRPLALSPGPGAQVRSPVTFSWTPVPGVLAYELSATLEGGQPVFVGETTGTSLTAHLGEGRVTWTVEAEFDGCDDTISTSSSFEIPIDRACIGEAPLLLAPRYGATDQPTEVDFLWTPVANATRYRVLLLTDNNEDARTIGTTTEPRLRASVPSGPVFWAVLADFESCSPKSSSIATFTAAPPPACTVPAAPEIAVEPRAQSGNSYRVLWDAVPNVTLYDVEESLGADFVNVISRTVDGVVLDLANEVAQTTRYFHRVRALSNCGAGAGRWSPTAAIVVGSTPASIREIDLTAAYGRQGSVTEKVAIEGADVPTTFVAASSHSWLSVSPASGTIPPGGLQLAVTAQPAGLGVGTTSGAITVTRGASQSAGKRAYASTSQNVPVSISLVTPVAPDAGNAPLPISLIIPAVAHVRGVNARFASDVRILNTSAQVMTYLLNFIRSGTDSTKSGQQTRMQVGPGESAALDDVLENYFGFAAEGDDASGALEVRPLATNRSGAPRSAPHVTFVSSRTYALTARGTLGQFVPGIPFSQFIGDDGPGNSRPVLSLQQLVQSGAFRTNLGLVEGSGEPASVQLTVFGDSGERLGMFPIELQPGEHRQLNSFLQTKGLTLANGRVEVSVASSTGKVTAYASVIDNASSDPMLVLPVDLSKTRVDRVILPGIADTATPAGRWRSDIRILNAGTGDASATLTYVPEGSSTGATRIAEIRAGQTLQIDDVVRSFFQSSDGGRGGSVIVTMPSAAPIVATARTYHQTTDGSFGLFIPGVTVAEGAGVGDRAMQVLQLEESERFRTNLGIVELSGNPVDIEIIVFTPQSKVSARVALSLQANEFRQLDRVLRQFGFPSTTNARIAIRAIGGTGTVSGYAAVIDNTSGDPTYVPAQ